MKSGAFELELCKLPAICNLSSQMLHLQLPLPWMESLGLPLWKIHISIVEDLGSCWAEVWSSESGTDIAYNIVWSYYHKLKFSVLDV